MAFDSGEKLRRLQLEKEQQKNRPNTVQEQIVKNTAQRTKASTALARIDKRNNDKKSGGDGNGSKAILDTGHQEVHIADDLKDMPEGCKYIISDQKRAGKKGREEYVTLLDIVIPPSKSADTDERRVSEVEHTLGARVWKDPKKPAGYGHQLHAVTEIHQHSGVSLEAGQHVCIRIEGEAHVLDLMNELKMAGKGPLIEYKRGELHSETTMNALKEIKNPSGGRVRAATGTNNGPEKPKTSGGFLNFFKRGE